MRLIHVLIFGVCLAFSWVQTAVAEDKYDLFVKICSDSPKTIRRNCSGLDELPLKNTRTRLYAYLELTWSSQKQSERPSRPLYLRWEFVPTGEASIPLSNPKTRRQYIWRPATHNDITFWDVNQRAYQDRKGLYRFVVFRDLSDWEGSIVDEKFVTIGSGEG